MLDWLKALRHKATTVVGLLVTLVGLLTTPDTLHLLPPSWGPYIVAGGALLAAIGRSLAASSPAPPPGT